jgi:hypothetical protein
VQNDADEAFCYCNCKCLSNIIHVISVSSHVIGSERVDVRKPRPQKPDPHSLALNSVAECPHLKPPPRAVLQQQNVSSHFPPSSLLLSRRHWSLYTASLAVLHPRYGPRITPRTFFLEKLISYNTVTSAILLLLLLFHNNFSSNTFSLALLLMHVAHWHALPHA